ncbi:DUF4249 domain-containing protein [Owenweeksia hongkongensis]|uniref:DUF4249 domain-containing protein n=1 Tax=Owenweeksia hongkongensis TaxID=253245 RepID=UPI003A91754A
MKNLSILLISAFVILLSSCTKVVDLKLNEPESKVAVDGLISNRAGESFIKLAYTKGYLSSDEPETIIDAQVSVRDNRGNLILFTASGNDGLYLPPTDFVGEVGKTYTLAVQYEGGSLSAESTMNDTVSGNNVNVIKADITDPYFEAGYHLLATIKKYKDEDSFYKGEIFINGVKQMTTASDIVAFDDRMFEAGEELEARLYYWAETSEDDEKPQMGDVVTLQLISISEETYEYLSALSETPMQGGLFGKTPANVPTNIKGGLGWFQASSYGSPKHSIVME